MAPLLLHESTAQEVPRSLQVLLASLSADTEGEGAPAQTSDLDLVVVLVHLLLVESGFTPLHSADESSTDDTGPGFSVRRLTSCRHMPRGWRSSVKDSSGMYAITYVLPPFEQYHCRMVALPSAETLIANLIVSGVDAKPHCLCINPKRYLTLDAEQDPTKTQFRWLHELSLRVKNRLASPLRSAILLRERVSHASLAGLPLELQLRIAGLLSARDVVNLGATCRALRPLAQEPEVWRRLVLRDFGPRPDSREPGPDWLVMYRLKFEERSPRIMCGLVDGPPHPLVSPLHRAIVDVMFSGHCIN